MTSLYDVQEYPFEMKGSTWGFTGRFELVPDNGETTDKQQNANYYVKVVKLGWIDKFIYETGSFCWAGDGSDGYWDLSDVEYYLQNQLIKEGVIKLI